MRVRNSKDVKYYLYVSSGKIEMLYPQVADDEKKKKANEWKIDLKYLSYSRKTEREPHDTQEARLEAIVETLDTQGKIGTIEEPKDYFRGRFKMRWGIYADSGRPNEEPPLVYFGGTTAETIFGLGGSSRNVIGFRGAGNTGSRSVTPYLVAHLLRGLDISNKGWDISGSHDTSEQHTLEAIAAANEYLTGPDLQMEFVAKTLLVGRKYLSTSERKMKIILGTPLYVAEIGPFARIGFN
jgi:hypothetical protein